MNFQQTFLFLITFSLIISGCAQRNKTSDFESMPTKQGINSVVENLSRQIASSMLKQNKSKVAVTNFLTITGDRTELGLFLSDKVTNSLFQFSDKFEVVERRRMKTLQEEILLGMTGVIDDNTAQNIGKAAGADTIVIGNITDLGETVDVSLRLLGTERGNVIATATAAINRTERIGEMLKPIIKSAMLAKKQQVDTPGDHKQETSGYCGYILNGSGVKKPFISARYPNGSWIYTVPFNVTRSYSCDGRACVDGIFTVNGTNINVTLTYGGSTGKDKVSVRATYSDRIIEGNGNCTNSAINYEYVFIAGGPVGRKAIAKIAPR